MCELKNCYAVIVKLSKANCHAWLKTFNRVAKKYSCGAVCIIWFTDDSGDSKKTDNDWLYSLQQPRTKMSWPVHPMFSHWWHHMASHKWCIKF